MRSSNECRPRVVLWGRPSAPATCGRTQTVLLDSDFTPRSTDDRSNIEQPEGFAVPTQCSNTERTHRTVMRGAPSAVVTCGCAQAVTATVDEAECAGRGGSRPSSEGSPGVPMCDERQAQAYGRHKHSHERSRAARSVEVTWVLPSPFHPPPKEVKWDNKVANGRPANAFRPCPAPKRAQEPDPRQGQARDIAPVSVVAPRCCSVGAGCRALLRC